MGPIKKIRKLFDFICELFALKSAREDENLTYAEKKVVRAIKIRLHSPNYQRKILFNEDGNDLIADLIDNDIPTMISRLGNVELACISFYLQNRLKNEESYPKEIRHNISNNAGFFPLNNNLLDKFSDYFLKCLASVDIMGVWFNNYEDIICNNYCKDARLVELCSLEPFRYKNPWSSKLKGKKVLVVHPFVESIKKQYYEKRHLLFNNPEVLPDFELKTIKAVQSIAGSDVAFETWFDAYHHMCNEIKKEDFDFAIIGAGAYGLPLASFVKSIGKKAIHLGGVTQILFGIKGKRWETEYADSTAKLFNENWIRPLETEKPKGYKNVEGGCYW